MTTHLLNFDDDQAQALVSGLALTGQIFWGLDLAGCESLLTPESTAEIQNLAEFFETRSPSNQAATALGSMISLVAQADSAQELHDKLGPLYVDLFVSRPNGIAASLCQSAYETDEGLLMGRPAIEMERRLTEVGIDLARYASEPADHLAVELEYLLILLNAGWSQAEAGFLEYAEHFAREELLAWLPALKAKLSAEGPSFYLDAATLVLSLVKNAAGIE